MNGYNGNFESYVTDGTVYDTYYIKFNNYDQNSMNWNSSFPQDSTVIIAVKSGSAFATALENALVLGLGPVSADNECITTTSTTTAAV